MVTCVLPRWAIRYKATVKNQEKVIQKLERVVKNHLRQSQESSRAPAAPTADASMAMTAPVLGKANGANFSELRETQEERLRELRAQLEEERRRNDSLEAIVQTRKNAIDGAYAWASVRAHPAMTRARAHSRWPSEHRPIDIRRGPSGARYARRARRSTRQGHRG